MCKPESEQIFAEQHPLERWDQNRELNHKEEKKSLEKKKRDAGSGIVVTWFQTTWISNCSLLIINVYYCLIFPKNLFIYYVLFLFWQLDVEVSQPSHLTLFIASGMVLI